MYFSIQAISHQKPEEDLDEALCSSVKILYQGKEITELVVTEDSVDLESMEFTAAKVDDEGKVTEEKVIDGKQIRWYTSVETMATVSDNGKVTRKMNGDVSVYAVPLDGSGVYGKCVIHFAKKSASALTFAKENITLQLGLKYYMEYEVLPEGANQEIIWTSENEKIATVDQNGMITAVAGGTTNIVGTLAENSDIQKSIQVTVAPLTVKKINLTPSLSEYKYADIGTTKQLSVAQYIPDNADNKGIKKWESSDESVVTVDKNGLIKIVGSGMATISAYSMDMSCKGTSKIYVKYPKVSNLKVKEYTNDKVKLSWDEMKGADGYYIYQWDASASDWKGLNSGSPIKNTEFEVKDLTQNTSYTFCVRAYNAGWETGTRVVYQGEDSKVSIKTLAYIPVTSLWCNAEMISLSKDKTNTYKCTYGPNTANYKNLKVSIQIADEKIASIEEIKEEGTGVYSVTIKGLKYGSTKLVYEINDAWHKKMEIPVRIVTEKFVSGAKEDVTVTASAVKSIISFKGFENEKEMVAEGSITGYMVRRTQTMEFRNFQYVEAKGLETYTVEDTTVKEGKTYEYAISPCYKDGENYFNGYGNGRFRVTVPIGKKAEKVVPTEKFYTVVVGKTKEISGKVEPGDVSITALSWSSDNELVATVKRSTKEQAVEGMDYAIVSGKQVGSAVITLAATDESEVSANTTIVVIPGKVEHVQTASATDSIGLLWDGIDGVSGYYVYRQAEGTNTWEKLANVQDNCYTDKAVKEGMLYRYKIAAYYTYQGKDYTGEQSDVVVAAGAKITIANDPIVVTGYYGAYDGKEHEALSITGLKSSDRVTYSKDAVSWSNYVPKIKNVADSKIIYVSITRDKKTYYLSVVAKVSSVSVEDTGIHLSADKGDWTGKKQNPKVVIPSETAV